MGELNRRLGLPALTFYGVGTVLGAGIYSVLGAAAGLVGDALWISFALSSLVALLTALSYCELATSYPQAGAEYVYLREAIPGTRVPAGTVGLMIAASSVATAATVALAFAGYFASFVALPPFAVAASLLALLALVAIMGIRESAALNVVLTLVEVGGLLLVIAVGLRDDEFGAALAAAPSWPLLSGAALVFFSYLGFENVVNLAQEAREPERNLPRAILLSLAITTVLYVLVALAAVALLSPEQLAASDAPLASAVASASRELAVVLGAVALFATANTALASIVSASRVLYGMAEGRDLPRPLAAVGERRKTPWAATLVVLACAGLLLPLGKVELVASLSSFAALIAFVSVNATVILLRYREPRRKRPFRVPLQLGRFPLLPALGAALSAALLSQLPGTVLLAGTAVVAVVALGFLARSWWGPRGRRVRSRAA